MPIPGFAISLLRRGSLRHSATTTLASDRKKSGTRDFHGSAYEYLRNSAMNANTWVRNQSASTRFASPFRYNNFGFTFGGPVWIPKVGMDRFRNKFFFFVNEDWRLEER